MKALKTTTDLGTASGAGAPRDAKQMNKRISKAGVRSRRIGILVKHTKKAQRL